MSCATSSNASKKLREWLAAGAHGKLVLREEDFEGGKVSLCELLYSGSLRTRLVQYRRSFCAWMGRYSAFTSWKEFWFRRAGASIGKDVFFSPGAEIDLLFPQLITFEDGAVMGMGSLVSAHLYTPGRIIVGRATIKRGGVLGGRAALAITSIGEEGVLGVNSYTMKPVPDGHTAIGVPAVCRKGNARTIEDETDEHP